MPQCSRRHRPIFKVILLSTIGLALAAVLYNNLSNNIHTVVQDQVYRSGQLSAPMLAQMVAEHHIRSVVNLRGSNPQMPSYAAEIAISKQLGLHHYDVRLNSQILPSVKQLHQLIHILQTAPRPILVHCLNGADRSGLAAAIALELEGVKPLPVIEQQFSWQYHVILADSVGKQVFRYYENWLAKNKLPNTTEHFLQWADSTHPFAKKELNGK